MSFEGKQNQTRAWFNFVLAQPRVEGVCGRQVAHALYHGPAQNAPNSAPRPDGDSRVSICCPWSSLLPSIRGMILSDHELWAAVLVPRCRYLRPASRGESGSVLIRIRKCVAGTLAARNVGSAALLAPRGRFRRTSPHFQLGRRRGYQRRRTSQLGRRRLAASAAALPRASFVAAV